MLRPNLPSYNDIDITNDLFEQLSVSLDSSNNKFLRHKHITSKPKLKRLLKIKSCSSGTSPANLAFCTRCKKETYVVSNVAEIDQEHITEKEVEVKKELIVRASEKKVQFINDEFCTKEEIKEKADKRKVTPEFYNGAEGDDGSNDLRKNEEEACLNTLSESETASVHFQSVFFASRPSIIGNNEFWLPKYSSSDVTKEAVSQVSQDVVSEPEEIITAPPDGEGTTQEVEKSLTVTTSDDIATACSHREDAHAQDNSMQSSLSVFLNNIFAQTPKRRVKILQVAVMLDGTVATLTDEHFFKCKHVGDSYEILDAISLKDVQKIMVSDNCALLVLEVRHASSLAEFKEFVPGFSEKTESLISLMVYALSRIKNFLLDVIRLPLLALPTCEAMLVWLDRQNEDITYTGIATAENISNPDYENLFDESFMMKIGRNNQFHPVLLLIRAGYLTSKCNGGCAPRGCKYSVTLELEKEKVNVMRREDNPWPNCVRLITECMDITFASSRKSSADDLVEKLYSSIQTTEKSSVNVQVFVLVTKRSLQLFTMDLVKAPLFGSPILNLDIFDEDVAGMTCIIDSQGTEVDDLENLQTQSRWHLTFLDENEKLKFLTATTVE